MTTRDFCPQKHDLSLLLSAPEVDWRPEYIAASSWLQHIPFAFWIISAVRPRCFVELGTHRGVSYFAFCQAVKNLNISTRCFAVDSWEGDSHSGLYDQEVFEAVVRHNDQKYSAFSNLLRMQFDKARNYFNDREIDLLHIDGFHTYESVSHDFDFWKTAISRCGIVLFHDINVREKNFGVWKLWNEISGQYPHFEFNHGYGLGLAAVGEDIPDPIKKLCTFSSNTECATSVRDFFSVRGSAVLNLYKINEYKDQIQTCLKKESGLVAELHTLNKKNFELKKEVDRLRFEQGQVYASLSWRITAPLRGGRSFLSKMIYQIFPRVKNNCAGLFFQLKARCRGGKKQRSVCQRPSPVQGLNVVWVGGEPNTPGYYYRVIMPAMAAQSAEVNASFCRLDDIDDHLFLISSADIIILWRAAWDNSVAKLFRLARESGAKVCFDLDDLMFDSRLATVDVIDGIRTQFLEEQQVCEHYARVHQSMEAADFCIATTSELAGHMRAFGKPASVLPNGFDENSFQVSRLAIRRRRASQDDGLLRIGYAGGSKTHQRDFSLCANAVARMLQAFDNARLVLFRFANDTPLIDLAEFPELAHYEDRVEWRRLVPFRELPNELARFDVNLAPLEVGNLFCEAKSELKFFEAALAGVCTVASPTGPYRRAIRHGETGFLAATESEWYDAMFFLLSDKKNRKEMAQRAYRDILWSFGPERRAALVDSFLGQIRGGRGAAKSFALYLRLSETERRIPEIPEAESVFEYDRLRGSAVTIAIPLYNYQAYILEALESVAAQTEEDIDLIVVDDASTDNSLKLAVDWAKAHTDRFNRLLILKNRQNSKLGPTRNVAFDAAETPYVLPLDADNLLLPQCISACLETMRRSKAAFVYPKIKTFGSKRYIMGDTEYIPHRFIGGNYIDAMALISKSVWSAVGGYENVPFGWEDYEFWCRIIEMGIHGEPAGKKVLAKYRIHDASMLATSTNIQSNFKELSRYIQNRHPWLQLASDEVEKAFQNKCE